MPDFWDRETAAPSAISADFTRALTLQVLRTELIRGYERPVPVWKLE